MLTVPAALDFHDAVGPAYKAARLRYLRDRWVRAVRGTPGIDILTPDDRDLVAGITSFRIHGRTGRAENQAVAAELLDTLRPLHRLAQRPRQRRLRPRDAGALQHARRRRRLAAALKAIAATG